MPNIFEYKNYQSYLNDYYIAQKAAKRNFSYRSFSIKAGIKAPSFLFYIIKGKRNLTKSSIVKISQAIGHTREEADYFEDLVNFNGDSGKRGSFLVPPVGAREARESVQLLERLGFIKMRIRELQQQIMEMARIDSKPSRSYQLNLHLIPVSKDMHDPDWKVTQRCP